MKKEILSLFQKTPQKNYYIYEKEGYAFICELLSFGRMGLLSSISENAQELTDDLFVHHSDILKDVYVNDHELGVVFKRKTTLTQFESVINDIVDYFQSHEINNVCCICHQHKVLHYAHDEEAIDLICDDCFHELKNQDYPSREILGFAGAFVLCVIPAIIWAYFHDFGYLIVLDGLLFAYLSFRGYLILGENMNRYGLIMCIIASVTMLLFGQLFAFAIEIQTVFQTNFKASISLAQAFAAIPGFVDQEVLGITFGYLGLCLLVMAIGFALLMYRYKKRHIHRHCHNYLED